MIKTLDGAVTLLDYPLPEGGPESVGLSASGLFPGSPPPGFSPSVSIILTEPAGEVPDGVPFIIPGTELIASDVLLADGVNQSLFFASDGDQNFATWVLTALGLPVLPVLLAETGDFQDMTPYLPGSPYMVLVKSDAAVPEPATALLVAVGMLGLAVRRRARI